MIFFIILICISSIGIISSIKYSERINHSITQKEGFVFILLFIPLCLSVILLFFPTYNTKIEPKGSPELIFWGSATSIPNNTEISYAPVINPGDIGDNDVLNEIQEAINNSMNLYLVMGIPGDYLNIDTAPYLVDTYLEFRNWLNDTLESEFIKGIVVDAEPPKRYDDNASELALNDYVNYLMENYPSIEEIETAEIEIKKFINLVHEDEKKAIIVKLSSNFDKISGDIDLVLLLRNIYGFQLNWDFSVSMLYRNQLAHEENLLTAITTDLSGGEVTGNALELSLYWFCYESRNADQVFIGIFDKILNESNYIKNKSYLKDIDILRHLNKDKVFFFDYNDFIYHYGSDGINEVVAHNQQFESWYLYYKGAEAQSNFIYLMLFLYLEKLLFFRI